MEKGPEILKKGGKTPPNRPPAPSAKASAPSATGVPAPPETAALVEWEKMSDRASLRESKIGQAILYSEKDGLVRVMTVSEPPGSELFETEDSPSQTDSDKK